MGTHADSIVCCLSLISATVKKYWPEPTWSRKKFIWLIGHSALLRETWAGTQDRNLHNHGETLPNGLFSEDCSTCFFSHTTQNHLSRGDTVHSDLSPSKQSLIVAMPPTSLRTGEYDGSIFPFEVSSSQMLLSCVKSTKSTTAHLSTIVGGAAVNRDVRCSCLVPWRVYSRVPSQAPTWQSLPMLLFP